MPNILIVEDSAVDRRLVEGLLAKDSLLGVDYCTNGAEALESLRKRRPDLIVTDLQMPGMDGLELVKAVRVEYPEVPVILITAHGSEGLAVRALEEGAASYVPKTHLADTLLDTVQQVLALARANRGYERLISCLNAAEFTFTLDNDPGLVDPLVDLVQQIVAGMGLCDGADRLRMGVALEEALLNAMYRGNLEISAEELQQTSAQLIERKGGTVVEQRRREAPYCDRRVVVHAKIADDEACFTITDGGRGFDVAGLPAAGDPASLEQKSGRGLVLMRTFMDEVRYNQVGNQVTLVKRRKKND